MKSAFLVKDFTQTNVFVWICTNHEHVCLDMHRFCSFDNWLCDLISANWQLTLLAIHLLLTLLHHQLLQLTSQHYHYKLPELDTMVVGHSISVHINTEGSTVALIRLLYLYNYHVFCYYKYLCLSLY